MRSVYPGGELSGGRRVHRTPWVATSRQELTGPEAEKPQHETHKPEPIPEPQPPIHDRSEPPTHEVQEREPLHSKFRSLFELLIIGICCTMGLP